MTDFTKYPIGTKVLLSDGKEQCISQIDLSDADYPVGIGDEPGSKLVYWFNKDGSETVTGLDLSISLLGETANHHGDVVSLEPIPPLTQRVRCSTLTTLRSTLETLRDAYQDLKIEFTRTPDTGYSGEAALKRMQHEADLIQQALELLDA